MSGNEKKKKKKVTKFKNVKNPGIKPQYQSRLNREYVDYDYLDKLTEEEKTYLSKFSQEYYSGTHEKDENGNYRYGDFDPKTGEGHLTDNDKDRRANYDRNNKKLKDVHGQIKVFSGFVQYEELGTTVNPNEARDIIIDASMKDPKSLVVKPYKKQGKRRKRLSKFKVDLDSNK